MLIHELISSQIHSGHDTPAAESGGVKLSYRQLESRANRLANRLRAMGLKPGELVGVYLERSVDMLVALLGTLKAGGAYVPLDPAFPPDRITYMLADSKSAVVLIQSSLLDSLPEHTGQTLCLDRDADAIGAEPDTPCEVTLTSEAPAYVIYTSGSTGRPKGVQVPHRAVVNFLNSMLHTPGLSSSDRLLAVTTLSFDIAGLELYLPLVAGAEVVIASRADASDGTRLAQLIERERINVMQATPATWRMLLDSQWTGHPELRVFCGGEALPRELAQRLLPCCKELWNLYGPTETTIWSTVARVEDGTGPVPIGKAIDNTDILILDDDLKPVPAGVAGELFIGGAGVATGYYERPELTEERFIIDPTQPQTNALVYRTGDLVKAQADGVLEHLGRVDFQVKVRGFRIELGEIEAALDQLPTIKQAVVMAREDTPGDKRLVAYVVPATDAEVSSRALRQHLAESLPDYMVPGLYMTLDKFPLTPNGKVDRNALPAPGAIRPELSEQYVAPESELQTDLTRIWAEVLRVDQIGINDDFFELGGDSLKVAQIATRVREGFKVELSLRDVFDNPTVAALAIVIENTEPQSGTETELGVSDVQRGESIPLTFAQERVWFLHQFNPMNLAYNFQARVDLRGALDVGALEKSLGEVLRRHESYRTSFPTQFGRPVQVVHPYEGYDLPLIDYSEMSDAEQEAALEAWCKEEFEFRFDLAKVPLVIWHLFKFRDDHYMLMHMEHHLVHDGWAFNVFLHELVDLYSAYAANPDMKESPLGDLPAQFAEFAIWQREWMQGPVSEQQLAYWKRKFATIPPVLDLPHKGPRPAAQSFKGASLRPEFSIDLCHSLRALSRTEGCSLFMTMLTAFIALLHRYTGEPDVAIGTFFANRRPRESEQLIGMILNNVVIRASLEEDVSMRELIRQVRGLVLEGAAHQDVPFDRVVETVQPKRDPSYNPLFQVMFSFHDEPMPEHGIDNLDVKVTPVLSNGSAKFDLGVIGIPHSAQKLGLPAGSAEDGLTMIWEHNTDLFETSTIERMVDHYKSLLRDMVANPDRRVSEMRLSGAEEMHESLVTWNATEGDYSLDSSLHGMIEAQVATTPDAVAVVFEDQQLTYAALNSQANQLANVLRTKGAGPGKMVGLCVERSARMLVALLGILKSGAAYVPIDPSFPLDRQQFMVEDGELPLLVTEQGLGAALSLEGVELLDLDDAQDTIRAASTDPVDIGAIDPESPAYMIFTSGSTGRPKGVQIPHRAIVNFLNTMARSPGLSSDDRLFAVTTLSFDIAGLELYLPLTVGAQVIVGARSTVTNPELLAAQLAKSGTTVMQATPSTWKMLLDFGWSDPSITALCGGEALPRELAERLLPAVKVLWNMYGPTETTIWSTIHRVTSGVGSVPIGKPIHNTEVFILDGYNNPVPVGIVGELCIGGAGVALGYWKRAELNAERFIANPVTGARSPTLYRTGDLARYLPDGTVQCLGRTDHQVKLRGFRIELGEIETLLDAQPTVSQAVVIAREDTPGDARLVGYVVLKGGNSEPGASAEAELLAPLREHLPDYMLPSALVIMDALPLTPNGKIDRLALPKPSGERSASSSKFVAPRTAQEEAVQAIWEELLGVSPIGVYDDFFEIGGHSLMAVLMVSEIEARLGTRIAIAALLQGRTIDFLAGLLTEDGNDVQRTQSSFITLKATGRELPFFAAGSHPRYAEISKGLDSDRPIYQLDNYALQSQRLADGLQPFDRIEEFADVYMDQIREVQPHGPYHLGGGCEGAYIAYEIATRLQRAGEEVASLLMWIPPPLQESKGNSLRRFPAFMSAQRLRYVLTSDELRSAGWPAIKVMLQHERIEYNFFQALCAYKAKDKFDGEIILIRTEVSPPSHGDINQQWRDRASRGAQVHVVPGSHSNWLTEHIDDFVGVLNEQL